MKYSIAIVFVMLMSFLLAGVGVRIIPDRYEELTEELERGDVDSLRFEEIKEIMRKDFPNTKTSFELVSNEFYSLINPIWTNDSLNVSVLSGMLEKYPRNNRRRTIYQYYLYSLANLHRNEAIMDALKNFRRAFKDDYISWYLSARYYSSLEIDSLKALSYAEKAYLKSRNYPKLKFYPKMEWELEKRSAPVKSATLYANLLLKNGNDKAAKRVLNEIIKNNELGIEDEETLASCYYIYAKYYDKIGKPKKSAEQSVKALVAGDLRNSYAPLADSLLRKTEGMTNSTNEEVLVKARELAKYKGVTFKDATSELGLSDVSAGRVALADYNLDGYVDILLDNGHLYKNNKGIGIEDVTSEAFNGSFSSGGSVWADMDNDGDYDIVTKDPEAVWLNNNGVFSKPEKDNGLSDNGISTEGLGVGDVNGDGLPDIYYANYEIWTGSNSEPFADQYYQNIGNGRFKEMTAEAGLLPEDGKPRAGRGVNFGDFDNDGDLDIYVSNYRLQDNFLWQNDGTGHFTEVSELKGVKGDKVDNWYGHTIGSQWGDIDNDGDLDLICANLAHPRYIDFSNKTRVYINSGAPDYTFTDRRKEKGIVYEETHSEPLLADFDNNGYLDLYLTSVYDGRRSFLYMQQENGTYIDNAYLAGVRHFNGWGSASADFNNDGKMDFIVCGGKIQLFINTTEIKNNWLEIDVKPGAERNVIGTRILFKGKHGTYTREIEGGKGTTNQSSLVQHIGLGKEKKGELVITYPDGQVVKRQIEKVNRRVEIE